MLNPLEVAVVEAALRRGRSQREVARRLGLDRRTVAKIARGEHPVQREGAEVGAEGSGFRVQGSGNEADRKPRIRRLLKAAGELLEPVGVELRTDGQVERYARLHARKTAARQAMDSRYRNGDGNGEAVDTTCARCMYPVSVHFERDGRGAEIVTILADGRAVTECPNCRRHFPPLRAGAAKDLLSL